MKASASMRSIRIPTLISCPIRKYHRSLQNSNLSTSIVSTNRESQRYFLKNPVFIPPSASLVKNLQSTGRSRRGWYPLEGMKMSAHLRKLSFFNVPFSLRPIHRLPLLTPLMMINAHSYTSKQSRKWRFGGNRLSVRTRPVNNMSLKRRRKSSHSGHSCAQPAAEIIQVTLSCKSLTQHNSSKRCSPQHRQKVLRGTR